MTVDCSNGIRLTGLSRDKATRTVRGETPLVPVNDDSPGYSGTIRRTVGVW